jgi:predicted CopG family antitoxin
VKHYTTLIYGEFLKAVKIIRVSKEAYEDLKKIKVHPREIWGEVIRGLLEVYKEGELNKLYT